MSLFGESPPAGDRPASPLAVTSRSLFDDDEPASGKSASNSLFADDDFSGSGGSPWDMPTPRKQKSRADVLRTLLPTSDAPDSYIETFDAVVKEDSTNGKINAAGVAKVFAAARLGADDQTSIMSIVAPNGNDVAIGRDEFNVLLALVGLAQDGESVNLDSVDERRRSKSLSHFAHPYSHTAVHPGLSTQPNTVMVTYALAKHCPLPVVMRRLRALSVVGCTANCLIQPRSSDPQARRPHCWPGDASRIGACRQTSPSSCDACQGDVIALSFALQASEHRAASPDHAVPRCRRPLGLTRPSQRPRPSPSAPDQRV